MLKINYDHIGCMCTQSPDELLALFTIVIVLALKINLTEKDKNIIVTKKQDL